MTFSCQSKQVSRCCINFPHELTCQILTNQRIKIGRRAWPTRDHGKKRSSPPVFLNNWLNFRVRGKFEIKILIVLTRREFISNMSCLCHYGPALLRFWFQTYLGHQNSASCLKIQARNNLVPRAFPLKIGWGGKRPWHRLVTCPLVHPEILGVIN